MLLNPFTLHSPKTLTEAAKFYAELDHVKLQAGGTFLFNTLKLLKRKGNKTPRHIINLNKIDNLKGIHIDKNQCVIKSMTTIAELLNSPDLTDNLAILKIAAQDISTTPIRNMATIGGNLTCRYTWTEMPAIMTALEAKLHFMGEDGKEEIIPAEDFFQKGAKTRKILFQISIPHDKNISLSYQRVKKTIHVDIPLLTVCLKTQFNSGQFNNTIVAVNNGIGFAQRDHILENFLNNTTASKETPQSALDHITDDIYDTRSDEYKQHMFRVSIRKAIEKIIEKK